MGSEFFGMIFKRDINILEKLRKENDTKSYRQPTQVDRSSRPRGAREGSSRNSAKQLGVISRDAPLTSGEAQLMTWDRLFTKNTGPCKLVRGSIRAEA